MTQSSILQILQEWDRDEDCGKKRGKAQHHHHLFEVEGENHHAEGGTVYALGKNQLFAVCKILAVLLKDVIQSETELQFGNKLEEGKVKVTSQSSLYHYGEGLRLEFRLLSCREVVHRGYAGNDIGTVIIETGSTDFEIYRNTDVTGLHILEFVFTRRKVTETEVLGTEMQGRKHTKSEVLVHFPFAQNAYRESEIGAIGRGDPLLPSGGVDIAVVF